jgi:uncharacterized protein YcbK (DUF882 family)
MLTFEQYAKGHKLTAEAAANARRTIAFINDVEAALGNKIRVTSTIRTPEQNAAVGGVPNSKHLVSRALAVDFVPVSWTKEITDVVKKIANNHGYGYLDHNVSTGRHIHCEYKGGAAQKKTLKT